MTTKKSSSASKQNLIANSSHSLGSNNLKILDTVENDF